MRRGSVLSGLTSLFLFAASAARAQVPAKPEFEVTPGKPATIAQALKSGYTAALLPAQEPPVFHSGTRLVEVEVVVRGKPARPPGAKSFLTSLLGDGPPFGSPGPQVQGLTKDDFTLLDNEKPVPVAFFREAGAATPDVGKRDADKPGPLPPGVVSNRVDSFGEPSNNATVILMDQLNTIPDLLAYERQGVAKMLRTLSAADTHVALYTMGRNLHVLQDFTSDPHRLLDLAAKLDQPHGSPELAEAFKDYGGLLAWEGTASGQYIPDPLGIPARTEMTTNALKVVIQHLARVPGRKNLVWLMDTASAQIPPVVAGLLLRTNIVLYPVMVRGVGCWDCPPEELAQQGGVQGIAAATGGTADAMDLSFAVHTAEEDSRSSYVLGFYPSEEMLDGRYHRLTVKVHNTAYHLNYRPGYIATKAAPPAPLLSDQALLDAPLDSAGIGLTAQLQPDPDRPGERKLQLVVDLHDVHLEADGARLKGAFDVLVANRASGALGSSRIAVDIPMEALAEALETGYSVIFSGIDAGPGELRAVVRDPSANAAGSLRIPVPKE
jgi:VWFA-related protein